MTVPAYSPYEQTVLNVAAMEPCVGRVGSRDLARRLVHADLAKFGLSEADLPAGRHREREAELAAPADGPRRQGGGVTAQIFEWVRDNPQATREDARRQFSHCNPSTVAVQFGKARRS